MEFEKDGHKFSDEGDTAKLLNDYLLQKGVQGHVFLVSLGPVNNLVYYTPSGVPWFITQQLEAMAAHIDIVAMVEDELCQIY